MRHLIVKNSGGWTRDDLTFTDKWECIRSLRNFKRHMRNEMNRIRVVMIIAKPFK